MNVRFNYPGGVVILLGVVTALGANYVLPATNSVGESTSNWLHVAGILVMFVGIALVASER